MTHDVTQRLEAYGAYADAAAPAISIEELEHRSTVRLSTHEPARRALPNWVVAVGAAAVVFILIGGVVWLIGGHGTDVIDEPSPSTTTTLSLEAWNPILATTRAKPASPAATCPPGTDPNTPGPADQERPKAGSMGNLAAAFDRHAGRIVYVDTIGETWTFDVCTNTWLRMDPTGVPIGDSLVGLDGYLETGLVYDVDSDLTVAFGYEHISVYDANTNTWTRPSNDTDGIGAGLFVPEGVAYDPATGLIIVASGSGDDGLRAYDVDSNTWTLVGRVGGRRVQDYHTGELLGYSGALDRLVLTNYEGTRLVDPRSGEATTIATETPHVGLSWPNGVYGPADDTVYVALRGEYICGFDTMVGDPINQRLILINGTGGSVEVWAIDFDTGEWTQILAPSTP